MHLFRIKKIGKWIVTLEFRVKGDEFFFDFIVRNFRRSVYAQSAKPLAAEMR